MYELKGSDVVTGFGWNGSVILDKGQGDYPLKIELHVELGKSTLPLHYWSTRDGRLDLYHRLPTFTKITGDSANAKE